jgi:hypothetical protein
MSSIIKNGKGDKWRKTHFRNYWNNFPESMGPRVAKGSYFPTTNPGHNCQLLNGDRTHELVPIQTDGGGTILVEPTELLDYPRDGDDSFSMLDGSFGDN